MNRTCTTCKTEKPAAEFGKRLSGLAYKCKACVSAYNKAYWAGLSAEQKASAVAQTMTRRRNSPGLKEAQRAWRNKAAAERAAYNRAYDNRVKGNRHWPDA